MSSFAGEEASTAGEEPTAGSYPISVNIGPSVQSQRTVLHKALSDTCATNTDENFCFVVGADCQLGMYALNKSWEEELNMCRRAVAYINALSPRPAFISMCGDLADMEPDMYTNKQRSKEYCVNVQLRQFRDFKKAWAALNPDIPLVCLCGNHDVGNAPSVESIDRFKSEFGDDYFSFWCKGCYCICLNTNLYNDKSNAPHLFDEQHEWFEKQLKYARNENARRVFVFGHHPWFLFEEDEDETKMEGYSPLWATAEDPLGRVPDAYFVIKREERRKVMALCKEYQVDACFAGHYHQNNVAESSFGMPMVVTGPITPVILHSTAIDQSVSENATPGSGVRVVQVNNSLLKGFSHSYELI